MLLGPIVWGQVDFLMESVDSKPCQRVKFCLGNHLSKKREISSAYFDMVVEIFQQNIEALLIYSLWEEFL